MKSPQIDPRHGPALDAVACALFFACSPGTPSCALCVAYLVVTSVTLLVSICAVVILIERLRKIKIVRDPAFQVACADLLISGSLCVGGWLTAQQKLERTDSWFFFHLSYCSSLAATVFALLTARALHRVVVGNTNEKKRFLLVSASGTASDYYDSEESDDENIDCNSQHHDERDSHKHFSFFDKKEDRGLIEFRAVLSVWCFVILVYGIIYSYIHQSKNKRSSQIFTYGATLALTLIIAIGIIIYLRRVVQVVFATYPQKQRRRLIRGAFLLIGAYAFRAALVSSTLFISIMEPVFEQCDKTRSRWPWSRTCTQALWASASLVDAAAILINSRHRYESGNQNEFSFSAAIAPLALYQLDETALRSAESIGSGTFGLVKKLKLIPSGPSLSPNTRQQQHNRHKLVALKCPKYILNDICDSPWLMEELESFRNEAYAVAAMDHHENICRVLGIAESMLRGPCLVCEFMDLGSLEDLINDQDDESNILCSIPYAAKLGGRQVAQAMAFLHSRNLIHLDLKPGNILLSSKYSKLLFKVSDFGTARVLIDINKRRSKKMTKDSSLTAPMISASFRVGTMGYMAPELLYDDTSFYDAKVDCFSYAICIWNLAANRNIWWHNHSGLAFVRAVRDSELRPTIEPHFDPFLSRLMKLCWAHRPQDRPHFSTLLPLFAKEDQERSTLSSIDQPSVASLCV